MKIRLYKVKSCRLVTSDVLELTLLPKSPKERMWYYPGQYAAIGFKRHSRPSPMRCFSITSSPMGEELQFSMRVQGDFTSSLRELEPGDTVFVRGPYGHFVIDETADSNVILLAGGIGVTPFMSMIRNATQHQLKLPITLLYSNSVQSNIPFMDEILKLERENPMFRSAFFVTKGGTDQLSQGRVFGGRITKDRLASLTKRQFNGFTYFICGPKNFTSSMKECLIAEGTDENRIITEEFTATGKIAGRGAGINKWTYGLAGATLVVATAFIMLIDLARSVPKLLAYYNRAQTSSQQTVTNSSSTQSTPATQPSPSAPTSTQSTTAPVSQSTVSPSTTPTPPPPSPQPTYTQTYQPPVTSVS